MAIEIERWPWPMIGAGISAAVLLIAGWTQIIGPILRKRKLRAPAEVYFHIRGLQDGLLDYVIQDDQGHSVKELVLPPNNLQYIEIQYLPKINFHLDTLIFSCEGENSEKPTAVERTTAFIATGKNRWVPGVDDSEFINRKGGYHATYAKPRNIGTWYTVGFNLQTRKPGIYKANLCFVTDEVEGNAYLTIRVEDKLTTKRLRCLVEHKGCYVRTAHRKV